MYYRGNPQAGKDGSPSEVTCYAQSRDGRQWTKPDLGLFEVMGTRKNNVILAGMAPLSHNFCPFVDPASRRDVPRSDTRPWRGPRKADWWPCVSADGLRWQKLRDEPVITGGAFDSQNVAFWSESGAVLRLLFPQLGGRRAPHLADHEQGLLGVDARGADAVSPARRRGPDRAPLHKPDPALLPRPAPLPRHGGPLSPRTSGHLRPAGQGDRRQPELLPRSLGDGAPQLARRRLLRPDVPGGLCPPGDRAGELGLADQLRRAEHRADRPGRRCRSTSIRTTPSPLPTSAATRCGWTGFLRSQAPYQGGELVTKPLSFAGKRLMVNFATSAAGGIRVEIQDADRQADPRLCPERRPGADRQRDRAGRDVERRRGRGADWPASRSACGS